MVKVLCVGDIKGRFDALYARVHALNNSKHGPFDLLFCVGVAFSAEKHEIDQYVNGTKTAPIATYFITAGGDLPPPLDGLADGGEICNNMFFLGQAGLKIIAELKVAFLSGTYNEKAFSGVDLLLTSEWGRGVQVNTVQPIDQDLSSAGSPIVSEIAAALKPRYHFCGTEGFFWERPPYMNAGSHATRFISLASVPEVKTSDKRLKWLHALNLVPMQTLSADVLNKRPPGTTNSPYSSPGLKAGKIMQPAQKRQKVAGVTPDMVQRLEAENEWLSSGRGSSSFFFGVNSGRKGKGKGGIQRPANFTPQRGDAGGMDEHKVFVGGVSFNVDGNRLWSAFSKCGEVLEAKVIMDKVNPNHSRGFGFVTFTTSEAAARAVAEMNDTDLDGRTIRVNASTKKTEPQNNRNGGSSLFDARARTECWFCLASEKVETWLISSIGDEVYLSQPKGAMLPDDQLIVPIEHVPSCAAVSASCWAEMMKFKDALLQYYRSKGCGMALFERHTSTSGTTHGYLNAVPVPIGSIAMLQDMFIQYGAKWQMSFEMLPSNFSLPTQAGSGHYFYVELLGEEGQPPIRLIHKVTGRFRLQFGREVCSQLLKIPERADWKACVLPKEQEEALTTKFKEHYKPFDFTLAED